jgi:hypothetical protein
LLILLCLAAAAGLLALYLQQGKAPAVERGAVPDKEPLSVFAPNERGLLERRTVEAQRQLPDKLRGDALFRALKDVRCIPDRLRLYELAMGQDGVLYLNISKEFLDRSTPEREITMTYGLVNSFIESFRGAGSVQLLVEGEPVYTRSGILYIFKPLSFNKDILED